MSSILNHVALEKFGGNIKDWEKIDKVIERASKSSYDMSYFYNMVYGEIDNITYEIVWQLLKITMINQFVNTLEVNSDNSFQKLRSKLVQEANFQEGRAILWNEIKEYIYNYDTLGFLDCVHNKNIFQFTIDN